MAPQGWGSPSSAAATVHECGVHWHLLATQVWLMAQLPHEVSVPQPGSGEVRSRPQLKPSAAQLVVAPHWQVPCALELCPPPWVQRRPAVQLPHCSVEPQPSGIGPQGAAAPEPTATHSDGMHSEVLLGGARASVASVLSSSARPQRPLPSQL
jgi:hypothetical protein